MKRFTLFFFIITLAGVPLLFAQQARFDEATALLEAQEYRDAIDVYNAIAEEGYSSGALWLNLGISYAHLDSLGKAKFYLLQAERHTETKELAEQALGYVNERFNRRSAVLPPLPWERFFEYLSLHVGVTALFITALFFLYLGVAALITSWFLLNYKRSFYYSGLTSLIIAVLVFSGAVYTDYLDERFGTGVIVDRQTAVYQQPQADASIVSTAYEGYSMRVDFNTSSESPGWKYVRMENGRYGWVAQETMLVF